MELEAHVEAQENEVHVEPQAKSPVGSEALKPQLVDVLVLPDISGLGEKRALKFPQHLEAVLHVGFYLDVSRLVGDDEERVHLAESRPERPDLPAAHAARAAAVELLLERKRHRVAVIPPDSSVKPERQRLAVVAPETESLAQREGQLHILVVRQAI